ncbi:MAG: SMP-30/gluconolactonase/LRE family protein [bacterium]
MLALVGIFGGRNAAGQAIPAQGSIERLDPAIDALIPLDARIEKIAEGFTWAEGPVWRQSGGYLLFSDVPRNTIYKWQPGKGLSIFMRPSGYSGPTPSGWELGSNGLAIDGNDAIVMADHGNRQIARIVDSNATKITLADRYEGKRFNSPNDLVYSSTGDLYFTDPPYGLLGLNASAVKEQAFNGVFRLGADGKVTLITRDLTFPNGIALSPDERTLYVAVSDGNHPVWMAYDILDGGKVSAGRIFFDPVHLKKAGKAGSPDGMKVDANGNLFATGPGGILVLTPQGKHLGTIVTGERTANVAFGEDGRTLYITADHKLLRLRLGTRGKGF